MYGSCLAGQIDPHGCSRATDMLEGGTVQGGGKKKYYTGTLDAWQKIYQEEGRKVIEPAVPPFNDLTHWTPHVLCTQQTDNDRRAKLELCMFQKHSDSHVKSGEVAVDAGVFQGGLVEHFAVHRRSSGAGHLR